jgi:hypothetical protein
MVHKPIICETVQVRCPALKRHGLRPCTHYNGIEVNSGEWLNVTKAGFIAVRKSLIIHAEVYGYSCAQYSKIESMKEDLTEVKPKRNRRWLTIILLFELVCIAGLAAILLLDPSGGFRNILPIRNMVTEAVRAVESGANIPGLHPEQVISTIEAEGFACSAPRVDDKQRVIWKCTKTEAGVGYELLILSRDENSIDLIDANINQDERTASDEKAAAYLCYIGTLPFDGQEQVESCQWISVTLPSITEAGDLRPANFNGLPHLLYGIASARSLELGSLP